MSKELTPLEALNLIAIGQCKGKRKQYGAIVRAELDRLEKLERAFHSLSKDDEKAKKLLSLEIEKNRALEIIKKKELLSVFKNDNGKYFIIFTGKYGFEHNTAVEISQAEFDLLKEYFK